MKIEFRTTPGPNIEVLLIEELSGAEVVNDRIFTSGHQGGLHFGEGCGAPVSAKYLFRWVEESWRPPIIGGSYSQFHPYWHEREEKRKQQENP